MSEPCAGAVLSGHRCPASVAYRVLLSWGPGSQCYFGFCETCTARMRANAWPITQIETADTAAPA